MSNIIVLGIAGGSGSGKTTLMKNLIARFQDDVTVLSHDNYYRPYDELTIEERRKLNYDHPDAFDTDMMIGHLKELKAGHSIECPVYDYATYSRTSETVTVEPRKVILVEGILIFENRALCDQMDIKIFVDTDADVRLIRRIRRDVAKRGRSLDSVLGQYLATVKPMHEQFVEPSKKNADLVVLEGGKNLVALMLKNHGFHVIDLGKDVPQAKILESAKEHHAEFIALSALMTTTMQRMREIVAAAKEEGITAKIIIGGAVITQEYADEIGADGYSKDAADAVKLAKSLM